LLPVLLLVLLPDFWLASRGKPPLASPDLLFFSADFAAQKARCPRDEFFLPSLKRAPGAVSLCGFPTRRRQKNPSLGARLYALKNKRSDSPRYGFYHPRASKALKLTE
jgi:hypothetical protein